MTDERRCDREHSDNHAMNETEILVGSSI